VTDATRDADLLASRDHHDPHRVLGVHPDGGGWSIRTWRPLAQTVVANCDDGETVPLSHVAEALFAGRIERAPGRYIIETTYPDGSTHRTRDPYSFAPTVGSFDLHILGEGRLEELWRSLGAHPHEIDGAPGVGFAVWAPAARSVSVVGDWNGWDGMTHPMRSLGGAGVWELFIPGVEVGARYKFEIRGPDGTVRVKSDPVAAASEAPPRTASVVEASHYRWHDDDWMAARPGRTPWREPVSVYEVHLGSWRRNPLQGNRSLTYREHAEELVAYVADMGFTHVELLPVMEHPFAGSWGYQSTGYFAPTARFGSPDDFRALVDAFHAAGLGVVLDWVPAHFPRDDHALAMFDGTALYEHADPRRGAHPDWGTLIFNYGRTEVRNFLFASALYWLEEMHADGLRVDAVASMLYLDYSRKAGEWVPNAQGGREDPDAIAFLRELNERSHARAPGIAVAAEESTSWPGVSRPTGMGGLGFDFKWNLGWMHDTLRYFARDPIHRSHHHDDLTFGLLYAFSEQFVLPLSHDEVVHGKGSLLSKMPGDRWQQLANLRALYGWMWAHPGKKLLFMGGELAQEHEWNHDGSVEWHLRDEPAHAGVAQLVRDLNRAYRHEPALWELDADPAGFAWIEANDAAANVLAFCRFGEERRRALVCVANLSPVPREGYSIGLPNGGRWQEVLNTDALGYGGSGHGNFGAVTGVDGPLHGFSHHAVLTLPPLSVTWLAPERA
jgi:1,4-alpha-glucan branching enzyme